MILFLQLQRTCTCETNSAYIPFYQLYTPSIIKSKAEFTSNYHYSATGLTFNGDSYTSRDKRLFKLPLIPATVLNHNADISVVITVGLQSEIRDNADSDPKFFLSDGDNGIGFDIRDGIHPRCEGIQAYMGDEMTGDKDFDAPRSETRILSEEFVLIISPSQQWGSCYFAADSGLISPVSYTQSISLDQGVWLEVYREGSSEEYVINYIIVEIHEN